MTACFRECVIGGDPAEPVTSKQFDIIRLMPTPSAKAPEAVWLLGHDVRWRLAQHLSRSDHRVSELVEAVGERQNLVSYHLGLLRGAGLVSERRSSYDSRDVYYSLNLGDVRDGLDQALAGLHPALIEPRLETTPAAAKEWRQQRLLFLCTGNSARSLIAEAIVRERWSGVLQAFSAGPRPAGVHPLTLEVLRDTGIDSKGLRSKGLAEVDRLEFDYVITLCDIAREECPPLPGSPEYMHWSLPDPAAVAGTLEKRRAAFKSTASELIERISQLVQLVAASGPARKSLVGGRH